MAVFPVGHDGVTSHHGPLKVTVLQLLPSVAIIARVYNVWRKTHHMPLTHLFSTCFLPRNSARVAWYDNDYGARFSATGRYTPKWSHYKTENVFRPHTKTSFRIRYVGDVLRTACLYVCLSVCSLAYLENHPRPNFTTFSTLCLKKTSHL